jgi:hypothetical protein
MLAKICLQAVTLLQNGMFRQMAAYGGSRQPAAKRQRGRLPRPAAPFAMFQCVSYLLRFLTQGCLQSVLGVAALAAGWRYARFAVEKRFAIFGPSA